jgi:hypothetical protein
MNFEIAESSIVPQLNLDNKNVEDDASMSDDDDSGTDLDSELYATEVVTLKKKSIEFNVSPI